MTDQIVHDEQIVEDGVKWYKNPVWVIVLLIVSALLIMGVVNNKTAITNFLGYGQEATATQPQPAARQASAPAERHYTIQAGNTLTGLFGGQWRAVCELNRLANCNKLTVGQRLRLPAGVEARQTPATTSAPAPRASVPVRTRSAPAVTTSVQSVRRQSSRDADGWWHWTRVGGAPLTNCGDEGQRTEEAMAGIGLIESDKEEIRRMIAEGRGEAVSVPNGTRYEYVAYCEGGHVSYKTQVVLDDSDTAVTARRYRLSSGRVVDIIDQCGNWAIISDITVLIPPAPPEVPTTVVPPPQGEVAYEVPVVEERTMAEETRSAGAIEYEAIAGVWVGRSGLANFRGAYAEGLIKFPLGDGFSVGAGGLGMIGEGESRVSDYSWDEWRYGPQVAFYNDRLVTRTIRDESGLEQTVSLPVHDGIKLRYLFDGVRGGNPTSGYEMEQRGHGIGIYAEHVERTSPTQMWGVTGEAFIQTDASIVSTWAGDSPQNRSMYSVTGFGQTVLDDEYHWQLRYGAGLTHQAWDRVNYLSLFAELRYDETIMCGPRLSLALNRPDSYRPYSQMDLTTLMAFCRIELGGKIREWDQERREGRVQLVQTGWRPLESGETVPEDARLVTEEPQAPPAPASDLQSIDLTGIGEPANDNAVPLEAPAVDQ